MLNNLLVFCARRRWLKRLAMSFLKNMAYINIFDGKKIYFNPKDLYGPSFHLCYGLEKGFINYEFSDKQEILNHLPQNGVFIDVGANIGLFSLYVNHHRADAHIISFEPDDITRNCFKKTVEENNLKNIIIRNEAVGKKSGVGILTKDGGNDGHHRLEESLVEASGSIKIVPLENPVINNQEKKINVIKIDVEGHELEVLKGAKEILIKDRPFLVVECSNEEISSKKGVYSFFQENFPAIFVRCPGNDQKYTLEELVKIAKKKWDDKHPISNYVFEFKT